MNQQSVKQINEALCRASYITYIAQEVKFVEMRGEWALYEVSFAGRRHKKNTYAFFDGRKAWPVASKSCVVIAEQLKAKQ